MKPRPQPRISPLALSLALAILAANAQAGEGTVTHGSAEISRDANGNTTIRQNSSRAIINWNDFSINAGKWMQFLQPGKDSAVLNRVLGGDPSRIFGEIRANGQVFVINPNGVVIGPTGVIQAAAFMASTLDVDPNAFMAGNPLRFSGDSHSAIRNLGFIRTTAGDVILVGRSVENAGGIEAGQGRAALIAANAVRLDPQGGNIVVEAGLDGGGTGVDNSGTIRAAQAQLSAAGGNVYALAINAGGTIEATGVENRDGRILLTSGGGDIRVDGTLKARNADGSGGTILVGGDKQGRNPEIPNAGNVTVGANALLDADAGTQGDGGKVVVWSDGRTDFAGHISARGGAEGGDGGFAEVSGKYLVMNGLADLRAAHGTFGTLLLDPDDIVIDTDLAAGGNHVTGSTSYLSAADIATQLGLGNLTVNTASANTAAGNITLQGSQTWTLADRTGTLDLIASNDFILNTSLSITSDTTGNPGDPSGAAGASINKTVGGLTVYAGRDIILNGSFSANYRVTGGAGGSSAALTWVGGNGGSVSLTRGAIDFTATRNILLNGSIGFYVRSDGGVGGQSTGTNPTQVGGNGGWASQVGSSASFTAGGDITVAPSASFTGQAEAHGGSAGAASPNASGGAGGFAVGNGMGIQFSAGGTFTQSLGSTMSTNAIGRGGHGSSFPAGGLGGGSGGGTATVLGSPITINAKNAILNGDISKAMSLQGGAAAPGSNGGSVSSSTLGNLQVNTSTGGGGNIILGGNINGTASLTNGSNSGSNTGGVASSSGSTFAFNADNDLIGNSATVNTPYTLFMSAGHSLLLNGGSLSAGNLGSQPLTLVADTAYPSSPNYGTGEIRLTGTSLIAANGVSIWGVSRALINLGSYTPSSWGTSPEWRGFPGFQPGVHCKLGCLGGTLTITADDKSMTYGDSAFPAFTASYAGFVNGDTASVVSGLQFNTTATLGSNVGTYVITPFGATAPLYYTLSYVNGTLTINPASLIVRVNDASKVYGAALPAFTTSVTGLVNGDSATSVFTANPTTSATLGSNAGIYAIAPNAALLSGNYVLSQVNGKLTVNRAVLTVTADDASRVYGDGNPAFTTSASGFKNGDSAASIYKANPTTTASVGSNVGVYQLSPGAVLLSGNYVLSQVDGKLTITPAPLRFSVNDARRVYGSANPAFTSSLIGLRNGDSPNDVLSVAYRTDATRDSNVGNYNLNGTATLAGSKSGNYALLNPTSQALFTIDPATLTVRIVSASTVRGDTPGAVQRSSSDYNAQQPAGTIRYTTDYASQYGTTDTVKWTVSGFGGNDFTLTGAPGFAGDGVTSPLQATPGSVKTSSNYVLKFDFGNPANWLTTRNPTITVNIADLFALSQTVDYISPVFLFNGLRGTYASQNNLDLRGLFGGTAWSWSVNPFALDKMSILAHGPASGSIPGDPYGPYDFSYDPNGGLLQLVGVSPGVTQGLTKQQLLMTMGPGVPLLTKDGSPKVPINIPPFTPMIFGLPVVFTSQINDIVSAYLRGTGQPSTPGDANNWLMTRGNDPAAYGTILPYLMNWLQDYESRMAVSKDLAHLNALIASDAWRNPLFSWSYKISFLDPLAKRVGFSFIGSMVDIAAYATQLRDFIQSKYPSPTVADQGLYDYIMAKLQNDRITAADKAITAYKDWKREAEERKNNKMPTLMSLFDLGESPPDELIIAAQTGAGGFSGDPVALQQVLTAAGTTMAGFAGGGALAANLTNISVGIATNLARGITTSTTGAAAGAFTGPAIIITTALQVAVQGILKIAHDANFEKNLRKAADETRQSRSFTSLMHGEGGKGEAIAGATMASLAGLLSQGSSGGAYAAVSNPPISVIVDPMVLNPTPIQVRPNTIIVVPSSGGSPTPIQPPPPASSRPQISEPATGLRLQSLENKRTEIGPPTMIQLRGVPERKAPPSTLGPIEKQLMPTERPRPSYTDPNLRVVPTESVPEKQPQQPQKTAPASPQTQTPAPLPGHRLQSLTNKRK